MSAPSSTPSSPTPHRYLSRTKAAYPDPREAITFYHPMDDREADQAPLSWTLIRRIKDYTKPYRVKRDVLFWLLVLRGILIPSLAWMIGATINGPIAHRDEHGILIYSVWFFVVMMVTVFIFHFRQRYALELGEAVVHDMRRDYFNKLMT